MTALMEISKLISAMQKKQEIDEVEVNTRKLLNLATEIHNKTLTDEDLAFIKSLKSTSFIQAYKEVFKDNNNVLDDMVKYEFAKENILSSPYLDDEEIY